MTQKNKNQFKRTKIVCTLGPATDDESVLKGMIIGGMNVARLNLSHGNLDGHLKRMETVRRLADELGEHVAVMFDTRGPDVRIGDLENDSVELVRDCELTITREPLIGNSERVSADFSGLPKLLAPGDSVFLDDGLLELVVVECDENEARCRVVTGGNLKSRKGINVPGKSIPLPVLLEQDVDDLRVGVSRGIDYISASFVNKPEDVDEIRQAIGGRGVPVIAKIESAEGVANLDGIIRAADGVMVARGDLGIEIPPEEVPGVQKRIIRLCREARKPVITATEMLESMTRAPRPTRAEITDVANAVLDGTSAVMLSQETAIGKYPIEVVEMMARICCRAEQDLPFAPPPSLTLPGDGERSVRVGIADAACLLAKDIDAPAIICVTDSGATAAIFSHLRPLQPVLACTSDAGIARKLCMFWGVLPIIVDSQDSVEALLDQAMDIGKSMGLIQDGDRIVFTGNLSGRGGETNLLATAVVGKVGA